jgi:nitroreductase
VERAPVIFVVCSNYVRSMSRYGERGILYGLEDATIACTYMMLAAHAKSLQSCWTGAFDDDEVRDILSLPQHIRPVSLLAVGKGHPPAQRTERMGIGEHVHRETW